MHLSVRSELRGAAYAEINSIGDIARIVAAESPDLVVNLVESIGGESQEEVLAAAVLEGLGVAFTGSQDFALERCLHKDIASSLLEAAGVPVPWSAVAELAARIPQCPLPAIVKPVHEDCSIGIDEMSIVADRRELREAVTRIVNDYDQPALIQQYVDGRELTISLVGWPVPLALPACEVMFSGRVFTKSQKLSLPPCEARNVPRSVYRVATRAFEVLGLRDYARIDIRLDASGQPWVIDVNPNCDLSRDLDFAFAAQLAGISFHDLINQIVGFAECRSRFASLT